MSYGTDASFNRAVQDAADTIDCAVCAGYLRVAATARAGDLMADAQGAVIVASARIAAHTANGHPLVEEVRYG